ncbi:hypothetical protein RJ640_000352 [Escallonia rubra]|uniref:Uncharacterized protein n=1 Tax=Escallonia rubra TaxID=112253 RepID=A0AA88QXG7_9ASTE|nr:hypothetical protein RJ640_000352 [Escallonia rubra]
MLYADMQASTHIVIVGDHASGEPPLLLAVSVHCALRAAIKEARKQQHSWSALEESELPFQLEVPATMPVVKELCGLDNVDSYLTWAKPRTKQGDLFNASSFLRVVLDFYGSGGGNDGDFGDWRCLGYWRC